MNSDNAEAATAGQPRLANGKQRLIDAALRLGAQGAGLSSLGIRELARESGLNHNTFYRHFTDLEDLARTATGQLARNIMAGMRKVRAESDKHADATEGAARYYLEEVAQNPDAFRVGLRELHGGSPGMRRILQGVLRDIAELSVEQIQERDLVPGLGREALYESALAISYYMFYRAVDFLDDPAQADQIRHDIVRFIRIQFMGALALERLAKS